MLKGLDTKKMENYKLFVKGIGIEKAYKLLLMLKNKDREMEVVLKRYIRGLNSKEESEHVVRCSEDDYVYKTVLDAKTKEEAEKEFKNYHYREYIPTYYDCTGQWFSSWHRIFNVNGQFVLYHCVSCDC